MAIRLIARDHTVFVRDYTSDQIHTHIVPYHNVTKVKVATHTKLYKRPLPSTQILGQILDTYEDIFMNLNVVYDFGPEALDNPAILRFWPSLRQIIEWNVGDISAELITRMPLGLKQCGLDGLGKVALKYIAAEQPGGELDMLERFITATKSKVTIVTKDERVKGDALARGFSIAREDL